MAERVSLDAFLSDKGEELLTTLSFEDGISLLEGVVKSVELGTLSLEHSVRSYERGMKLLQHLRTQLSSAEAKLVELAK